MKGLGKLQLKQRRTTENRIKTVLKRKGNFMNVNEIIRTTKKDPTAILNAIDRLVESNEIVEYPHKNKKLVGLHIPTNVLVLQGLKKT